MLFDKVTQNPLTTTVEERVGFAKVHGCGTIVAVGRGSIIDCAKGIAFITKNEGDINDYIFYIFNHRQSE